MKEIPFSSFYQAYQKGNIHVLDVREQEEYDALHLDGVRLLPLSELANCSPGIREGSSLLCHLQVRETLSTCLPIFWKSKAMMVTNVQGGMDAFES